ncbi:hypothetical protein MNB_SV-12-1221 [hydrothermal vent metagenome]|uniref:Uncharacterized protein n=1 Tax=hydrothermal vent metagenome TaxID=652676 RepID=A0A1W1CI26_9ZZZZ
MKIAIRGEGITDIGTLNNGLLTKGAILLLIEKLDCYQKLYNALGCSDDYNFIEWCYIHKKEIESASLRRKKIVLRGKKQNRINGTDNYLLKGFYNNSESFAYLAKEQEADIAIFFVDSDNEAFEIRYKQVKEGLKKGDFDITGVPMIPCKISEVWLLCCLEEYRDCAKFEMLTNDKNSLDYPKKQIEASGKTHDKIAKDCNPNKIDMPSFNQFRDDFKEAVNAYIGGVCI